MFSLHVICFNILQVEVFLFLSGCIIEFIIYTLAFQGEWILSGRDLGSDSKLIHVYMYSVKCVDIGSSKDPFLTQVSDFAVLLGNELDAEVLIFICTISV